MTETSGPSRPPNLEMRPPTNPRRPFGPSVPLIRSPPVFKMYINAVYYPSWRVYRDQPPSSMNLDCISHIFYAFASVAADGTVFLNDDPVHTELEVDGQRGAIAACTTLRRGTPAIPKILLSVGGGGDGSQHFAEAAATLESRKRFAISARELVDRLDLNGIDIDWEHPSDLEQGENYIQLLATLRGYLPREKYQITSALPAGEWALRNIELDRAASYLDFFNIMAYDFSGPWTPETGHQAQLYSPAQPYSDAASISANSAAAYFVSCGVPYEKLVLGIPLYGRSFLSTQGVGSGYNGHGGDQGTYDYCDLPRPNAQEYTDQTLWAAYCVDSNQEFVSYDNSATVRQKAIYVKQNGLGGLFYWAGTGDSIGRKSLVYVGFDALHQG